jgi:hypothetical protein
MALLEKRLLDRQLHEFYSTPSLAKRTMSLRRLIEKQVVEKKAKVRPEMKVNVRPDMTVAELCASPSADEIHGWIKAAVETSLKLSDPSGGDEAYQEFLQEIDSLWGEAKKEHSNLVARLGKGKRAFTMESVTKEDLEKELHPRLLRERNKEIVGKIVKKLAFGDDLAAKGPVHLKIYRAIDSLASEKPAPGKNGFTAAEIADAVHAAAGKSLDVERRNALKSYVVKVLSEI